MTTFFDFWKNNKIIIGWIKKKDYNFREKIKMKSLEKLFEEINKLSDSTELLLEVDNIIIKNSEISYSIKIWFWGLLTNYFINKWWII